MRINEQDSEHYSRQYSQEWYACEEVRINLHLKCVKMKKIALDIVKG